MMKAAYIVMLLSTFTMIALNCGATAPAATFRLINPNATALNLSSNKVQSVLETKIVFLYMPLFVTLQQGQSIVSQLTMKNNGTQSAYINMSVQKLTNMLELSTAKVALLPNQSTSISLLLRSNLSVVPGTYLIPVNVTTTVDNLSRVKTLYVTFVVQRRTSGEPIISSVIDLINDSDSAAGTIQISSPPNSSISNLTLNTIIVTPLSSTNNRSEIVAYGLENNITTANNSYAITWYARDIPAGRSVYGYYEIDKLQNQSLLGQINELFVQPSFSIERNNTLRLVNIMVPPFYKNYTNRVTAYVLYTGTAAQQVELYLETLPYSKIYNGTQTVTAQPGQMINKTFAVTVNNSVGTLIMNLIVRTTGANISYTLPVAVLPKPVNAVASANGSYYYLYIFLLDLLIIVIAVYLFLRRSRKKEANQNGVQKPAAEKVNGRAPGQNTAAERPEGYH